MRHRKHNIKFGRKTDHAKATVHHIIRGLIINKQIVTTKVKAKESSRLADKLVSLGKTDSLANRRRAYAILRDRELVSSLFNIIAPLFRERNGGYTRVMLTKNRKGDNAQMAILEFVEKPKIEAAKKEKKAAEPKDKLEEKPQKETVKPKKEDVAGKEGLSKKVSQAQELPEKRKEIKPRPGFLKKFFWHKKEQKGK